MGKNSWSIGVEMRWSFQWTHPFGSVNSGLCEKGHDWTRATVMPSKAWKTRRGTFCPGLRTAVGGGRQEGQYEGRNVA